MSESFSLEDHIVIVDGVRELLHPTAMMSLQSVADATGGTPEGMKDAFKQIGFHKSLLDPRRDDFISGKSVRMLVSEFDVFPEWAIKGTK